MNLKHLTNPKNHTYPRYETVEIQSDGRKIQKEHLSPVHARLYFPDWNGQLRLILINDGDSHVNGNRNLIHLLPKRQSKIDTPSL